MNAVLNDFETRVKEIDLYFNFLDQVINQNAQLFFPNKKRNSKVAISADLQKVLKAHGFLILYNLIESMLKKSMEEIYQKVTSDNIRYKDVRDEIKMIWIELYHRNFQQKGSTEIFTAIEKIADDVISMQYDVRKVIPGNVDQLVIREFAAMYGFSDRTHWQAKNGNRLHFVKSKRNDLAHGTVSFAECGKLHTLEDLVKTKREVVLYLKGILKNVEDYITSKKYLKAA